MTAEFVGETRILSYLILSLVLLQLIVGDDVFIIEEEGKDVPLHFNFQLHSTQGAFLVLERNGTSIYKFRRGEIINLRLKQIEFTRLEETVRFILTDVDTSDSGSYECFAHGAKQAPLYYLRVVPLVAEFSIRDRNGIYHTNNSVISVVEGASLELTCRFVGALRSNWTIGWIIDGMRLPQNDERITLSEFDDYHEESVLVIVVTHPTLDGTWIRCDARGEQISVLLEVTKRPVLQPTSTLTAGIPSVLTCVLNETVSHPPTFQWWLDDNDISSNSSRRQLTEIWYSSLEFHPIRCYLLRQLKCTINNEQERFDSVLLDMNLPPTMSMWHNETELGDSVWLEENQTVDLICMAYNSKPRVNFTWFWDETAMNFSSLLHYTNVDNQSRLYNSSSTITYTVVEESGNLNCSAGFDGSDLRWGKSVNVTSYVIPNLSISLNGETPADDQIYNLNENLTIKCEQGRARPDAYISLIVEGDGLGILIKSLDFTNATVKLSLNESGNFHVNCRSWQIGPNITTIETTTYLVAEPPTTTLYTPTQGNASSTEIHSPHVDLQYIVVAAASATLSSFLVFCLYKGLKKARASLSANLQSIDLSLGGVSSLRAASLRRAEALSLQSKLPPEMSEFDFGKIGTLPRTPEPTLKRSFTGPPRLKLPKIPSEEEVSQYSAESENYYSTTQETSSGRKMYGEKDMCIILNMKMGEIYNRWMGTIATSRETNKCVVFTTVTESTARKKEIHWDAFVKRALEMPKTNHVTCIEGIAIDKANFYLINEHVICDTLENKVLGKNTPEAETNLYPALMLSDVMKHATGIMEGMEVIHSFGFLHPGLSLKKVLLTNQGECKLYDFCLSEDASKIVETKKLQVAPSLNHFAPETLLRNEYVQGSDVWSIAVLMWEMMSRGNSPFHLEQELDTDDAIISPGKPWPERYQQLHNKTFFECWNKDCSLRPAVSHLKESFTKVFEALLENSFYEIPTSDLYAPMNAVTNFGGT